MSRALREAATHIRAEQVARWRASRRRSSKTASGGKPQLGREDSLFAHAFFLFADPESSRRWTADCSSSILLAPLSMSTSNADAGPEVFVEPETLLKCRPSKQAPTGDPVKNVSAWSLCVDGASCDL